MKKVVFILILAFLLAPSAYCLSSGTWGDGVFWTLTDSGSLTVYGEGAMSDGCPLTDEQQELVKSVTVRDGVTHIGKLAFSELEKLKTVTLGDSVKSLGNNAFFRCRALEEVKLSDSVTQISEGCFQGCSALKTVQMPSQLLAIDQSAFAGCGSLEEIELPAGLVVISDSAFKDCASLKSVVIPASVKLLGDDAFRGCTAITELWFLGDMPEYGDYYRLNTVFANVTAVGYYPQNYSGWTNIENKSLSKSGVDWKPFTMGDADGDGRITENDPIVAGLIAVNGAVPPADRLRLCDVDGSGEITSHDLIAIARLVRQ